MTHSGGPSFDGSSQMIDVRRHVALFVELLIYRATKKARPILSCRDFDLYDPRCWGAALLIAAYRCLSRNIPPIAAAPIASGRAKELPTLFTALPASGATVAMVVLAKTFFPAPATLLIAVPAAWYMPTAACEMLWPTARNQLPIVMIEICVAIRGAHKRASPGLIHISDSSAARMTNRDW